MTEDKPTELNENEENLPRDPVPPGEVDYDPAPLEIPEYLRDLVPTPRATARAFPVDTRLSNPSAGISEYYSGNYKYGIKQAIDALVRVGEIWSLRGRVPNIQIGDISKQGGGDIPGHDSHEKGIDVDIRPLRNDGTEGPLYYTDPRYSRLLTQELVDIISVNGNLAVQIIWFNDPGILGVFPLQNHSNHLHVRFLFPDQGSPFPLLAKGSRGAAVRELQTRLNFWIKGSMPGYPKLIIDGDFGTSTFEAVTAFQASLGLTQDGKVGQRTWPRLPVAEGLYVDEVVEL